MKQLVFMTTATLVGTAGVFAYSPSYGVFVYYLFAVLRPQYIWEWSLPPGISWSFYVAIATILGAFLIGPSPAGAQRIAAKAHRLVSSHYVLLVFACWIAVTYCTARNTQAAYIWFEEYLKIFVMYAVSAFIIRTVNQVWALFVMVGVVLAYISYEVNYHYFINHYLGMFHNGYCGLDNNGAGLMLAMGVPLCWFSYEGFQKWWRWAFVVPIPLIVHAVLMTYSRGAMLSLLLMCPALVLRSRHRIRLGIVLGLFAFVAIPLMAGPEIRNRFFSIEAHEVDGSANSRRDSWAAGWGMAKDNPIFGVGVRNANLYSLQYGADVYGRTIHSQYLQIAADNGLVGLALYMGVLGSAWMSLGRCRRFVCGRTDFEANLISSIARGLECSMLVFFIGAFFLSLEVFELPYLLLLLAAQLEAVSKAAEPDGVIYQEAATTDMAFPASAAT